ncbi:MAG: CPBP family intramembrane metalloprotease [Fimbriimonadaceae bacterium]|nr:CPBP family intramembrane metalloprotease [Fimbriimonadaceae bacterium]
MSEYEEPIVPPPILSGRDELGRAPRRPWVWWVLYGIFGLLILQATVGAVAPESPTARTSSNQEVSREARKHQSEVKLAMMQTWLNAWQFSLSPQTANQPAARAGQEQILAVLDKAKKDMLKNGVENRGEARALVALSLELKAPVAESAKKELAKSEKEVNRASLLLANGRGREVTPEQIQALKSSDYYGRMLASQALRAQSARDPYSPLVRPQYFVALFLLFGFLGTAFVAGLVYWGIAISKKASGTWRVGSWPWIPPSLGDSERWALRAILLIVGFFLSSGLVAPFALAAPSLAPLFMALAGLGFCAVAYTLIARFPIFGFSDPLTLVMGERKDWGKQVLQGLLYYCAMVPVAAVALGIVGFLTSRFGQGPGHPVQDLVTSESSPLTFIAIFVTAAIVAPVWEELAFRGFLAPALAKKFASPLWGVIVSSLLFALIHPQGPIAAIGLATLGAMMAYGMIRTTSLLPAIIVHAIHNGVLILLLFCLTLI